MKVIVSEPISEDGIRILKDNNIKVIYAVEENIDENFKHVQSADGWIIRSGTTLDSKIINNAANLSVIGRAGVGVDNIDISASTRRGIVVMNTPDANTISAAEHTMALILALSRNVSYGHESISKGEWNRHKLIGSELCDKTLGIVGLGKIGREVLQRSQAFNMKILGYDPFLAEDFFREDELRICDLDYLIENSDYITLHIPLTKDTKDLFDYNNLIKMKKGARIINVARGGIINEDDLSKALTENKIAGAGLDVTDPEPIPVDDPLLTLENCVIVPHIASASVKTRREMSMISAENLIRGIKGERLLTPVNPEVYD